MFHSSAPELDQLYQDLWVRAQAAFSRGEAELDPQLLDRSADQRRGMTLIIRPTPEFQQTLAPFMAELANVAPEQHLYHPAELHVTVLSLFTATPDWAPHFRRMDEYIAAVEAALVNVRPFSIDFTGVTASPAAVMIQGFPALELDKLRNALRASLQTAGFGDGLDRRYRLVTAHMTVLRFQRSPLKLEPLQTLLEHYRSHPFCVERVATLDLVDNNWYMSRDRVQLLKRYAL
ncbi:MAG: 2'-5' RNA ligase family protein [Anaerolineales bacterium]|nr:2'-5' RNA ligase family protein [Anaerolineales bacterium]